MESIIKTDNFASSSKFEQDVAADYLNTSGNPNRGRFQQRLRNRFPGIQSQHIDTLWQLSVDRLCNDTHHRLHRWALAQRRLDDHKVLYIGQVTNVIHGEESAPPSYQRAFSYENDNASLKRPSPAPSSPAGGTPDFAEFDAIPSDDSDLPDTQILSSEANNSHHGHSSRGVSSDADDGDYSGAESYNARRGVKRRKTHANSGSAFRKETPCAQVSQKESFSDKRSRSSNASPTPTPTPEQSTASPAEENSLAAQVATLTAQVTALTNHTEDFSKQLHAVQRNMHFMTSFLPKEISERQRQLNYAQSLVSLPPPPIPSNKASQFTGDAKRDAEFYNENRRSDVGLYHHLYKLDPLRVATLPPRTVEAINAFSTHSLRNPAVEAMFVAFVKRLQDAHFPPIADDAELLRLERSLREAIGG